MFFVPRYKKTKSVATVSLFPSTSKSNSVTNSSPFISKSFTFLTIFTFSFDKIASFSSSLQSKSSDVKNTLTSLAYLVKNKDSSISSSPFPTRDTVLPFVKAPSQVAQYETPAPKNLFSPFTFLAPIFPKPVAIIIYFVLKFPASVLTILTSS